MYKNKLVTTLEEAIDFAGSNAAISFQQNSELPGTFTSVGNNQTVYICYTDSNEELVWSPFDKFRRAAANGNTSRAKNILKQARQMKLEWN